MPLLCFINSSPEFSLLVEPPSGNAEHLIAEILLPGVVSNKGLVLDYVQLHVNTKYEILGFAVFFTRYLLALLFWIWEKTD